MGTRYTKEKITALDGQVAAGYSVAIRVTDFQHIGFSFSELASSDQVVKLQGSLGSTAPTFSSARIVDNEWDYVDIIDLEDSASIDGDTGITASGSANVRQFSANVDALDWISFQVVSGSAGAITTKVVAYSNQ